MRKRNRNSSSMKKSSRFPLGVRLTAYFVLFGLVTAYLTFITVGIGGSKKMIEHSHEALDRLLQETGSITTLVEKEGISSLLSLLQRGGGSGQSLVAVEIYAGNRSGSWERIFVSAPPGREAASGDALEESDPEKLDSVLAKGSIRELPPFFGQEGSFSFFLDVTMPADDKDYVLHVIGDREGLRGILSASLQEFLVFTAFVIAFSLLLSRIFVNKIVRPVRWLSGEAQKVSSGSFEGGFHISGRDEIAKLGSSLQIMKQDLSEQIRRIQRQADTLQTMNRIDKAVLSSISRSDLMARVTGFTASLYPENGLILLLKNETAGCFDIMYEKHGSHAAVSQKSYPRIPFDRIPKNMLSRMETQEVIKLRDETLNGIIRKGLPKNSEWVLNIPVTVKGDYYGSLIVSSDLEDGFSSDDIDFLEKLTDQIGVALQSVLQLEEKESLLFGSLKALSAAIDAKSRWTAGHSERVQHLAAALGRAAGLDENQLDCLSIAALLHDIGKLGIKEEILDKPGRLSEEEYAVIKTHPDTGAQIFAHIPQYPEVTEGIRRHHERWDGGGYPGGLKREAIPLIGRIICIADVYDALSADRPYREGMALGEITAFFKEERGRMFSPRLCDLFLEEVISVTER